MKNIQFSKSLLACALGVSLFGVVGCNKSDRAEAHADANKAVAKTENAIDKAVDKTQDAIADAKNAASKAWGDIKGYSFDKKDDFSASAKAMAAKFDAEAASLKAEYSEAKASAARKAAMEELKNSRAAFDDKVSAVGRASAATWDSAKADVVTAWERVQAAYYKARAN